MGTFVAIVFCGGYLALIGVLAYDEMKRHKIYMAKEQAQIDLYNKLYQKIELFGVRYD